MVSVLVKILSLVNLVHKQVFQMFEGILSSLFCVTPFFLPQSVLTHIITLRS